MLALLKKELRQYFFTPNGWVFLSVFLFISGIMFSIQMVFPGNSQYPAFLANLPFIYLFVIPLLTMRSFADERRFMTDQLLFTGPTRLLYIVLGKFLSALIVYLTTIALTFVYPLLLSFHGELEWPVILGTYIGFILLGMSFIAIGIFTSQLTENLLTSAVFCFCVIMLTFLVEPMRRYMPASETSGLIWAVILVVIPLFRLYSAGKNWLIIALVGFVLAAVFLLFWFFGKDLFAGFIGRSLGWLSLTRRFLTFSMGILSLDAVVYYLSFAGFFLFLTVMGLEKRRWS
ncbi:ABC-type transport system involved in multi-copper enzyme maturation, permease component [Olavius algarvensis spirochete endosymbiont]|uniref:ABC transporter permease n=1 Tax=Olavius algarvensis spirochete endosymbiont TaxID=260710 RepID=UPI00052C2F48|nr:hypothetical protein [Olavius algarvensis spirochete endosymbiont]KGM43169.1 hypothetical protein JY97_09045 [Alkalispirochaeta odontotermitis]VDA99716.1 ABC-type transport system involved in multi-copper enzyme maturation, permease component [Olavius algarvensis spirochete endosymbiont]